MTDNGAPVWVYFDAGEVRGGEKFTPFGFGAFLAVQHGEHVQVGHLG